MRRTIIAGNWKMHTDHEAGARLAGEILGGLEGKEFELLEPESQDSLISWGFFNREIVSQWRNQPRPYPVYRIPRIDPGIERYME